MDPNSLKPMEIGETSSKSARSRSSSSPRKSKSRSPSKSPLERIKDVIPAKLLGMKKSAKSGNKQKQKEVNQECEKLEKELEERHRQELLSQQAPPTDATPPVPEVISEEIAQKEEENEGGSDEEISSKFYKNFKISSKNAKKQAKKKEQEEKMKAAAAADKEAAKKTDTEKHLEKATIKTMLTEDRLKMIEIPADGDCMYNALVHQLQEENIEISVRKLRKHCAAFMREHPDDFRPFIADTDVADSSSDKESDWEVYLQGVERCAEVGGVWGGELELKAISMLYEKTIVVYRETGKYELGEEFSSPKDRALRIVYLQKAYHLGEHYNSTCFY